ncbi:MAG: hypothetical protein QME68_04625 [Elusimicrobiota bacterium]|nr:hypothetical protein [Elusimicrobiota bacterium]
MTWIQILAQAGVMASILGVAVAIGAYLNGKHIKEGVSKISEMIVEIKNTNVEMEKRAEQRHQEIMRTAEQRHQEIMTTAEQRHQEVMEMLKKGFGSK